MHSSIYSQYKFGHEQKFRLFILSSRSTRPRRGSGLVLGEAPRAVCVSPPVSPNIVPYRCRKRSAAANTYTHFMDASHHHRELNESKSPLELQALLRHRIVWHCHCQVPHNRIEYLLTARRQHRLLPAAQRRPHLVPERYTRPQHCPPIVRLRCTPRCRAQSTF